MKNQAYYYKASDLAGIWGGKTRNFNKILCQQGFQTKEINNDLNYYWKPTRKGETFSAYARSKPELPFLLLVWKREILDELDFDTKKDQFCQGLLLNLKEEKAKHESDSKVDLLKSALFMSCLRKKIDENDEFVGSLPNQAWEGVEILESTYQTTLRDMGFEGNEYLGVRK